MTAKGSSRTPHPRVTHREVIRGCVPADSDKRVLSHTTLSSFTSWIHEGSHQNPQRRKALHERVVNLTLPSNFFSECHQWLIEASVNCNYPETSDKGFDHIRMSWIKIHRNFFLIDGGKSNKRGIRKYELCFVRRCEVMRWGGSRHPLISS